MLLLTTLLVEGFWGYPPDVQILIVPLLKSISDWRPTASFD